MGIRNLSFIFCCFIIFTGGCAIDTGGSAGNENCPTCPTDDAAVNNNNTTSHDDRDDDGFTTEEGDCDDENPVTYPNASEICDGHDNDCDGVVDEGCGGCENGDTRACGTDEGECQEGVQVCAGSVWGEDCLGQVGPEPEVCGDQLDNDCDGLTDESCDEPVDADGDGFVSGYDCDDNNPSVHPYATELCNGIDDNCDGQVDENCSSATDADGDGFVSGYDCDDNNPSVHPYATELCNGIDDNCDGSVDEGCGNAADADGDGFTAQYDCNDNNPSVHPYATEYCNGIDDDCDGQVDEGCQSSIDADNDGFTSAIDCDDSNPAVHPYVTELCNGIDDNCDGQVDEGCNGMTCPNLTIERYGDQIWLSGERAMDFQVMEFWTMDSRPNKWEYGIQSQNLVIFPVPNEQGYDWFMPRTGISEENPGAVLLVPDPCVEFFLDVYMCSVGGQGQVGCPSLLECSQGGNDCPSPTP